MLTLENDKGLITISNEVFTALVGDAATRCFGVRGLADPKKENGIFQLLRRDSVSKGVKIATVGESIAIELHIIADQGVNLSALSDSLRSEIVYRVAGSTGVAVDSVEVYIDSIARN